MNYSVLQNVNKNSIFYDPFPHVIINDCLPQSLYDVLSKNYPYYLVDYTGNNKRGTISSNQFNEIKCDHWKNFMSYHNSIYFFNEVVSIFEDFFKDKKDVLNILKAENEKNKHSNLPSENLKFISTIDYNTAVSKKNSARRCHVDKTNKLFSGLFYLKEEKDKTVGGDLDLYSIKTGRIKKTIKYDKNNLVLFINNKYSYHGVSPRNETNNLRRFCFLSGNIKGFEHQRINRFHEFIMLNYFKLFNKFR